MTSIPERWRERVGSWPPRTRLGVQLCLLTAVACCAALVLDARTSSELITAGLASSPWLSVGTLGGELVIRVHPLSLSSLVAALGLLGWSLLRAAMTPERGRVALMAVWIGLVSMGLVEGGEVVTALADHRRAASR